MPYLPPPPPPITLGNGLCPSSLLPLHPRLNDPHGTLDHANIKGAYDDLAIPLNGRHVSMDLSTVNGLLTTKSESSTPTVQIVSELFSGHMIPITRDPSPDIDHSRLLISDEPCETRDHHLIAAQRSLVGMPDPVVQSRDDLVKLLAKEAYVSKSSSPARMPIAERDICSYRSHRRRSHDGHDKDHRHTDRSSNHKTR